MYGEMTRIILNATHGKHVNSIGRSTNQETPEAGPNTRDCLIHSFVKKISLSLSLSHMVYKQSYWLHLDLVCGEESNK